MKANEAPQKLYVNFRFIETHPESHQPLVTKQGINKYNIEYIRKDAFINNVCDAFCKVRCKGKPPRSTCTSLGTCIEYDEFKKAIKL